MKHLGIASFLLIVMILCIGNNGVVTERGGEFSVDKNVFPACAIH